ncbi:MAG: hypothetical protein ACE5IY_10125 [bacterium]
MLDSLKVEISKLGWRGHAFNPHKMIALLSVIKLLEKQKFSTGKIFFREPFKKMFSDLLSELLPNTKSSCRPHTPFFHLRTSSFWKLVPKEGKELALRSTQTIGGPGALDELVEYALISDSLFDALKNDTKRKEIVSLIFDAIDDSLSAANPNNKLFEEMHESSGDVKCSNKFVGYLNSLQRSGGSNENALAESQACNAQFASIHVAHPLADIIHEELRAPNGRHVILTGHAGDGKSTLALEIYKRLSGFASIAPLEDPPRIREDVGSISIIKDLSERDKNDDSALLSELVGNERRFLLVSNTGTLLDLIKRHPEHFGGNPVSLESQVLDAISTDSGEAVLALDSIEFRVFNLARMDNLSLARQIFVKMLSPDRWAVCGKCDCSETCPIYFNVDLLRREQGRVLGRIFLAYRRMYEYGTRLTIRQFTEHLSYLVTAGLEEADIQALQQQRPRPLVAEYLFFNRFFGDNGCAPDASAWEMKAVLEVEKQGFGERPSPHWEHRLWLLNYGSSIKLGIETLDEEFEKLRRHGSRETVYGDMTPDQAREQVRRMLFFLYKFKSEDKNYLGQYLNSPTLLDWQAWQNTEVQLGFNEKTTLERKIYHVLQEHFTGVRLPEGSTQNDRRLYVTLSRRRSEVRQSAQVVLAQVDWSTSTALKLHVTKSAAGEQRKDLVLCGKDRIDDVNLPLKVPFLDYVMMRHFGELGEVLEASYLERLDRFKAQVLERAIPADDDRIMLVRLRTDHTFRRQHFSVNDGRLEVTDVL